MPLGDSRAVTTTDDSQPDDTESEDTGSDDTESEDTGSDDTGSEDAGSEDTGSDDTTEGVPSPFTSAAWLGLAAPVALVALVLSVIALVVAINSDGSGGGGGGGGGDTSSSGGSVSTSLDAELKEFEFDLGSSTIAADTDVPVSLDNTGAVVHNFALLVAGANPADESKINDGMILVNLGDVSGGESGSGTLNVPAANYLVVCLIPGHFDAGMSAQLSAAPG